jgi:hypothetical protein
LKYVPAINCGFLSSLSKAKGDSFQLHWTHHIGVLDSSGGLEHLQRRQRSSSPSFASAQELLRAERTIVESRPCEDEMSGKKCSSSRPMAEINRNYFLTIFFLGRRNGSKIASSLCYQKRRELIALLKVTHPDRHVCYCRLLQLSCLSVGIVPGCGHVVQLARQ